MRRIALAAVAALVCGAVLVGCGGSGGHRLLVGGVEDAAKWGDAPGKMALAKKAGYGAVVVSAVWTPPEKAPSPEVLAGLQNAARAAKSVGIEPIVAVYCFGRDAPLSDVTRGAFIDFAVAVLRAVPEFRTIEIGNEPNAPLFWQPQFGPDGSDAAASAYFQLLAEGYDAVKAWDSGITVIGGSLTARGSDNPAAARKSHSPSSFIADLGSAWKASGRKVLPFDVFSIHPYPEYASIGPALAHPRTTSLGIADYDKLEALLTDAFGAPQPVAYSEFGEDTVVPADEASAYTGTEPPSTHAVTPEAQGADYNVAIHLAACQPLVRMLLFFHVSDETQLAALQTGLYWADDRPKPDLESVATTAQAARNGKLSCHA
jgi:hypothetical protein